MALVFKHYRPSGTNEVEVLLAKDSSGYNCNICPHRHSEVSEINSVKVEIVDNKPLYIPLGRAGPAYKFQFRTFNLKEFSSWYTVIGNDILKVVGSDYAEFPIGTYWNIETISHQELPGSAFAISNPISSFKGEQPIIFEYELEVSRSLKTAAGKDR